MSFWQKLAHRWLKREYIMEFTGSSGMTHTVKRVFLIHGWYFRKEPLGLVPLERRLMADSVFTLVNANAGVQPGAMLNCSWTPLTNSLLSFMMMAPEPSFEKDEAKGVRFMSFAPGDNVVD